MKIAELDFLAVGQSAHPVAVFLVQVFVEPPKFLKFLGPAMLLVVEGLEARPAKASALKMIHFFAVFIVFDSICLGAGIRAWLSLILGFRAAGAGKQTQNNELPCAFHINPHTMQCFPP
jgi:hypothetical protein